MVPLKQKLKYNLVAFSELEELRVIYLGQDTFWESSSVAPTNNLCPFKKELRWSFAKNSE